MSSMGAANVSLDARMSANACTAHAAPREPHKLYIICCTRPIANRIHYPTQDMDTPLVLSSKKHAFCIQKHVSERNPRCM